MEFKVWKVETWKGNFSYSMRSHPSQVPVVLNHGQFVGLFPDVDLESVPEAPGTAMMRIEANVCI